jgi:hypothetical protein
VNTTQPGFLKAHTILARRSASLLLTLMLTLLTTEANASNVGFSFLKVSPGARNAAMGDIGSAVASDLYGVFFNPAVTAGVKTTSVGFMHHENIFDSRREFVGAATPLFGGALSIGFDYFKIGSIEAREGPTEKPMATFDAQDILFYAGFARNLTERLALGATAKYAAERIESETAQSLMLDAGVRFQPIKGLSLGFAGRNIGTKPKFKSEEIDLPLTIAGGVAGEVKEMILGVEVAKPKGTDLKVGLGVERYFASYFVLRAGYKFGYDEENMAFGVGFAKSIWRIDYAFVPFKAGLGSNHRFALTIHLN